MSSDLERQDSLRTVLRKQKRRFSATEGKQSSPDLAGGRADMKSPFSLRRTPVRSPRGIPQGVTWKPRTGVSLPSQVRIQGILIILSFMFKYTGIQKSLLR